MRPALYAAAVYLAALAGCNNSDAGVVLDLNNDFNRNGTAQFMEMYVHKDIDFVKQPMAGQYIWQSSFEHFNAFWMGTAMIYTGPPMIMDFGNGQGPQTLVNTGQLIFKSGYHPLHRVKVAVTPHMAYGAGPMGPGIHYRALARDTEGYPVIVVRYDKLNEGKGTLDGLYTMLQYYYNGDSIPKDPVGFHTAWAEIFAVDDSISTSLRNSR